GRRRHADANRKRALHELEQIFGRTAATAPLTPGSAGPVVCVLLPVPWPVAAGLGALPSPGVRRCGADDGTRTRDPHLGKVMLYQLSHVREGSQGTKAVRDGRR